MCYRVRSRPSRSVRWCQVRHQDVTKVALKTPGPSPSDRVLKQEDPANAVYTVTTIDVPLEAMMDRATTIVIDYWGSIKAVAKRLLVEETFSAKSSRDCVQRPFRNPSPLRLPFISASHTYSPPPKRQRSQPTGL